MQEENKVDANSTDKKPISKLIKPAIVLILIVAAIAATFFVLKKKPEILGIKNQAQTQQDNKALIASIGKLYSLPQDEEPTVATVTDITKLQDQPFFKNAKDGDKVLVYTKSKQAILYRPSENRIIQVGAVNIDNTTGTSQEASGSPVATKSPVPTPAVTLVPQATPSSSPAANP